MSGGFDNGVEGPIHSFGGDLAERPGTGVERDAYRPDEGGSAVGDVSEEERLQQECCNALSPSRETIHLPHADGPARSTASGPAGAIEIEAMVDNVCHYLGPLPPAEP